MIPPEVLNRKSLFSLLYKIDQELSDQTRAKGCPFAGVRCTVPITSESLGVALLILKRISRFDSACAVAVQAAGVVFYLHRYGSVDAVSTGHRLCYWSVRFANGNRLSRLSGSSRVTGYGVQQSTAGNSTFVRFFPRASTTDG